MKSLQVKEFQRMLDGVCTAILANEKKLCELDSFVGDGDHGVTVARGFRAVRENIGTQEYAEISALLEMTGETLTETMGGAIGPIFGSIFSAAGEAAQGKTEVGTPELAAMLEAGLENVMLVGGAKEGDRTLVDSLAPAVRQLAADAKAGTELPAALCHTAEQAAQGVEHTKELVAKKGRAKFLGEKSKGHQDAGATSMLVVLEAMRDFCNA